MHQMFCLVQHYNSFHQSVGVAFKLLHTVVRKCYPLRVHAAILKNTVRNTQSTATA